MMTYRQPSSLPGKNCQRKTCAASCLAGLWLLAMFLTLSSCQHNDSDGLWQQSTIEKVQQVSPQEWDKLSAQRIPKLLKTIQTQAQNAPLAWLQLAFVLHTHDVTSLASDIFSRLEKNTDKKSPTWPLLRYFVALEQAKNGHLQAALKTLSDSLDHLNDLDRITFILTGARWLIEAGQWDNAAEWLHKAEKISPHYPELLYLQATLALQQEQCQRAIDKLRIMLEYKPGLKQLYAPLASAYRLCNQPELAEQAQRQQAPGTLDFGNRFTQQAEQLGNPIRYLRKQIKTLSGSQQLNAALKTSQQLLKLAPRDPINHLNQGSILFRLGHFQAAAAAYRKGLILDPDNAILLTNLGNAYWQLGHPDRALSQYRKALQHDPDLSQARLNLAGILRQQQRWDAAKEQLRILLEKQPDHALGRIAWLDLLLARKDTAAALSRVHRWLKSNPQDAQIQALALKALLQDSVSSDEAAAPWAKQAFSEIPGAQSAEVAALQALWRLKTGQLKTVDQALELWHREAPRTVMDATIIDDQHLRQSAEQVLAGKTPDLARFISGSNNKTQPKPSSPKTQL